MQTRINKLILAISIVITLTFSNVLFAADPKIVAHRGGKANFPENTIYAFKEAIKAGANMIEVDVQVTKDNQVVIYHPSDLSVWTEGRGAINQYNYNEIKNLNAAYNYDPEDNKTYPQRSKKHNIPLFSELLTKMPKAEVIVDLKSLPAKDLIDALVKIVDKKKAWDRLIFYSTNIEHLDHLKQIKPTAKMFESRARTRERLLTLRNEGVCCCNDYIDKFIGFELNREMIVEESFALGKDMNKIHFKLWDKNSISCVGKAKGEDSKIFLFGINNSEDYKIAKELRAYAVFTDNPLELIAIRRNE